MMKIHTLFQKGRYGGAYKLSWIINFPLKIVKNYFNGISVKYLFDKLLTILK